MRIKVHAQLRVTISIRIVQPFCYVKCSKFSKVML